MGKISAATLVSSFTGGMKLPTGEIGDKAVTGAQIAAYVLAGGYDSTFYFDEANDRLLLGGSTSVTIGGVAASLQMARAGASYISISRYSNNATPPELHFGKSRGATIGAQTVVQNSDVLGQISYFGSDGSDMADIAAGVTVTVDGTPGVNDIPARIQFGTKASGGSYAYALTLRNDQSVEILSTKAFHFGDKDTDGTWRIIRSGDNLLFQQRESGSYVTKSTING